MLIFEVISSSPPCWKQHLLIPAASKVAYSSRPWNIVCAEAPSNQIPPPVHVTAVGGTFGNTAMRLDTQ